VIRRVLRLAPVLLFSALVILLMARLSPGPRETQGLPPAALTPIADLPVFNPAAARKGPALVHVFASWCPTCELEHPYVAELAERGAPVFGLAWRDSPEDAAAFIRARANPYRAVAADPSGAYGRAIGVTGTPETFLVSDSGDILVHHVGPLSENVFRERFAPLLGRY